MAGEFIWYVSANLEQGRNMDSSDTLVESLKVAAGNSDQTKKASSGPLRYSLRAFFATLILLSLGIAIWQMPFRETVHVPATSSQYYFGLGDDSGIIEVALPPRREERTLQYLNFLDPTRHGTTRIFNDRDELIGRERWVRGEMQNREFTFELPDGRDRVYARWESGVPDGEWIWKFESAANVDPRTWRLVDTTIYEATLLGAEDGHISLAWNGAKDAIRVTPTVGQDQKIAEALARQAAREANSVESPNAEHRFRFEDGKLVEFNGQPLQDVFYLWNRPSLKGKTASKLKNILNETVVCRIHKRRGLLRLFGHLPRLQISEALQINDNKISFAGAEVPLCVSLYLLTRDLDIALDYRFGMVFVTTKADAKQWSDRTGVESLDFSYWQSNALLDQEVGGRELFSSSIPRGQAFENLETWLRAKAVVRSFQPSIEVDESVKTRLPKHRDLVTFSRPPRFVASWVRSRTLSVRDHLGWLLDQNDLKCIQEHDRIRILPQESSGN